LLSINVTTTSQRLSLCRITLTSLLLQTTLPDKINLWVSEGAYLRDKGISNNDSITSLIESLPSQGRDLICIRWVANTGPYRKLIPVLRESGPNDLIITADDDIFYGENWLQGLLAVYGKGGGVVAAARVRLEKINFLGRKTSYIFWDLINENVTLEKGFIVTFGGGVVLTRSMFREEDISSDEYLKLAPTSDDLWYSKLLKLNNNIVFVAPDLQKELNFIEHSDGLVNHNILLANSIASKIKAKIWDKVLGFLGFPVCGNDAAYLKVERYFDQAINK